MSGANIVFSRAWNAAGLHGPWRFILRRGIGAGRKAIPGISLASFHWLFGSRIPARILGERSWFWQNIFNCCFFSYLVIDICCADWVAASRNLATETSGIYTVTVVAGHPNGLNATTGEYDLYFARSVGANELGILEKGTSVEDEITVGDIDTFTFSARAGERIHLRLGDIDTGDFDDFYPFVYLYNPDGTLLKSAGDYAVAVLDNIVAQQDGLHTAVLIAGHANGRLFKLTNCGLMLEKV